MIEPVLTRLRGVLEMMALRPAMSEEGGASIQPVFPEWRRRFDVSESGFARSFLAAIPALPLFFLSVAGQNAVSVALASNPDNARPVDWTQGVVLFVCMWVYFPLVSGVFVRIFGLQDSFRPWVVVHNWTVLFLLLVQGSIGALVMWGLISPRGFAELGGLYFMFAIYAHCRAAAGSLDAPWPMAVGGACLAILLWLILQLLLVYAFAGAALQA